MPTATGPVRAMLAEMSPTWLSREWGEKLVVGLVGYAGDALLETATLGLKDSWLVESTSPDDSLAYIGAEEDIPQLPGETLITYRARVALAFDTWGSAGTEAMLTAQMALLGLTVRIYTDAEWARPPTPWWSQFWIVVDYPSSFTAGPIGDDVYHCGDGTLCGASGAICGLGLHLCGDGSLCGITGSATTINAMRGIVRRFKAGEEVCREACIDTDNLCGDGHSCNDGTLCGGSNITIGMI